MQSFNYGSMPMGERGVIMTYRAQHLQQQQGHTHHQHLHQHQHHNQQQQQHNHQYYSYHTHYQAVVSPNGTTAPQLTQASFFPLHAVVTPPHYYNHLHHQHHLSHSQHHTQPNSGVGYANTERSGFSLYTPAVYDAGYSASRQPSHRESHRGGRGRTATRGGHNAEGDLRESYFAVQLKSFAALDEAKQKSSIRESIHPTVFGRMRRRASPGVLKILVIVERQYLAACMSVPQSDDDVILSKEVAMTFLDVQHVYCDDGIRLVDMDDGTHVVKHVYSTLRTALAQLAAHDRTHNKRETTVNLLQPTGTLLLKDILVNRAVATTILETLERDDEDANNFWMQLLFEPAPPTATDGADGSSQQQQQQQPSGKPGPPPFLPSYGVAIFATTQGNWLFRKAMMHPQRREAFFRVLQDAAIAPPQDDTEAVLSPTIPERLFLALFSSPLVSRFVFECFGLVEGVQLCEAELTVLCAALGRLALKVVCSTGGSFLMTALVKALCPSRFTRGQKTSGKRGRDTETLLKQQRGDNEDQHRATGGGGGGDNEGNNTGSSEQEDKTNGMYEQNRPIHVVGQEYRMSEMSSEWRLIYAVARAFVSGPIPGDTEETEATLSCRVKLLTQHVVACRSIQSLIPFFADTVAQGETDPKQQQESVQNTLPDAAQFFDDCSKILSEIANQTGLLANHSYGNYVLQTVVSELTQRTVSGSLIQSILHKVFGTLISTVFEVSTQKFASNCVETAIAACHSLPDGSALLLRLANALLSEGPNQMERVAMHQFGNYVVRRVLDSLTDIATSAFATATPAEVQEACELELQYFSILSAQSHRLRQTSYGSGLQAWVENQRGRLQGAEAEEEVVGGG
ncbi:hypothetical protein TCSYLVIO_008300 [Trypanosoma cruzi]|nr:hypothetical protein TCSYLVIO_008300 [Trypanosoma cruzi]